MSEIKEEKKEVVKSYNGLIAVIITFMVMLLGTVVTLYVGTFDIWVTVQNVCGITIMFGFVFIVIKAVIDNASN